MTAVLALLIGIVAGMESPMEAPSEAPLAPTVHGAPGDRGNDRRGSAGGRASDSVAAMPPGVGSVTIERRVIIRIPTLRAPQNEMRLFAPRAAAPPQTGTGPRSACLSLDNIRGATMHDRAGILFVTNGNRRYQAVLERGCRPIDFQSGFYLGATEDGSLCAGRDMIHARSGLRCAVVGLKRLAPEE